MSSYSAPPPPQASAPTYPDMSDSSAQNTYQDGNYGQTAPTANGQGFKDSVVNSRFPSDYPTTSPPNPHSDASGAMNTVSSHPTAQNTKESLTQGPVAQSFKSEGDKTGNEFSGLANSRQEPKGNAATGQPLTHYHSFFYTLLSWQQPRATAISFASTVLFIFASRYLPLMRWVLKIGYLAFGATALAEIVGKNVMGTGVAASLRPRQYYRVPKEKLEIFLDDVEQLINFFVIEFQRVLFAENVGATVGAFLSALISYYLVKILPFWGMTLMATCVIYLGPLIYVKNKEVIDSQLTNASNVVSAQTAQFKDVAGRRTSKGFESMKQYTGDYATKAQGLMGSARQKMPMGASTGASAQASSTTTVNENQFPAAPTAAGTQASSIPSVNENQFPAAPRSEPYPEMAAGNPADAPVPAS